MKTCKAYLIPNYAKNSWKTYVNKPSGFIHKHVATKSLPPALTFTPDLQRCRLDVSFFFSKYNFIDFIERNGEGERDRNMDVRVQH